MAEAAKSIVLFNKAISQEISPPMPEGRPANLSYAQVQVLTRELRLEGWDVRTVVTRKVIFHNQLPNHYVMAMPNNWGVVIDLRTTAMVSTGQPYKPLRVQWVRDGAITEHWPEELVLLYRAVSQSQVEVLVKEQM